MRKLSMCKNLILAVSLLLFFVSISFGQTSNLKLKIPIEREISSGETHTYEVALKAGEFMQVRVEQKGIDITLDIISPGQIVKMDSPNGEFGFETLSIIAEEAGTFSVVVEWLAEEGITKKGKYSIKLLEKRKATPKDLERVAAEASFDQGKSFYNNEEYAQAYEEFDKLIPIWRKLGDKYMEAMSIRYLRWQKEKLGEDSIGLLNIMLRSLLDEVKIYQDLGLRREEAGIWSELGDVYTKRNEYRKLVESFEKAAAIYRKLGEENLAKEALDKTKDYVKLAEEEKIKIETEQKRKTQVKLGQKVEFVVQADREGEFIISPDNKLLANRYLFTDGASGFVSLWEISSGRMLRVFKIETSIISFGFAKDSKALIIETGDYIKTFNIITGDETNSVQSKDEYFWYKHKQTSPDGKIFAVQGGDSVFGEGNIIKLYETETGKIVKTFEMEFSNYKTRIRFSKDGKLLLVWRPEFINVFEVETGNKLKVLSFDFPSKKYYEDNAKLYSTDQKKFMDTWNELKRKEYEFVGVKFLENNEIQAFLQNLTGETVKSLKLFSGEENIITNLSKICYFSDDGKVFVTRSDYGAGWNTTLAAYGSDNFTKLGTIAFNTNLPTTVTRDNNGMLCSLMYGRGYPMVWNLSSSSSIQLKTRNDFTKCHISGDGNKVVLSDGISKATEKLVEIWDLRSNTKISTYTSSYPHNVIDFLPDINTVAIYENSGEKEYSINLIDVNSGNKIRTLAQSSSYIMERIFDNEQKILAYFDDSDKIVKVLDVKTGNILFQFPNEYGGNLYTRPDIQGIKGGRFRRGENSLTFSSDGKKLLIETKGELIRIFDLVNGKLIGKVQTDYSNYSSLLGISSYSSFDLSPDEKNLIVISVSDNIGDFWSLETGKKIKTVNDYHDKTIKTIWIDSGEGQSIVFFLGDKLLANLYSFEDGGWLVVTPEGLFDGTPNAWQKMIWRFDNNTFSYAPAEAFFKEFYRPGLLQDIYAGNKITPPSQDISNIDIRQPNLKIAAIDGKLTNSAAEISANKSTVKVKVEITDNTNKGRKDSFPASSGANDVRLFRNGSLVKLWEKDAFALGEKDGCKQFAATKDAPRKVVCETDVQITADKNEFSAYAFNHDNVKSNDATAEIKGAETLKRKGKLQILSVGVNDYAPLGKSNFDLNFAVADAVDFGVELRNRQINLKNYDAPEVVQLTDKEATKANILYALERFAKGEKAVKPSNLSAETDKKIVAIEKTQPEDVLMIYFAGHGTASKDRFYLIPHDGFPLDSTGEQSRIELLQKQSISDLELEAVLRDLDAGQILFVIDACNSGQALEAEEKRRGPMNSRGLAQLAFEKGMYILTAAQSFQAALEVSRTPDGKKIEHGLLTFSLLDGLTNANADNDSDKSITEREWFSFAASEVPRMQLEEMQKRDAEIAKGTNNRSGIYFLNGDKEKDANKRALQTPRVFYRRESSTKPFVVSNFP